MLDHILLRYLHPSVVLTPTPDEFCSTSAQTRIAVCQYQASTRTSLDVPLLWTYNSHANMIYAIIRHTTFDGHGNQSICMLLDIKAYEKWTKNKRCISWASCKIRKIAGAHAPGMPGTFSPSPQVSDPDMHHGTCVTHVPWCMPGTLTGGFLWNRWRGKRSRHSRRMRNLQFYVSGKRPMMLDIRAFGVAMPKIVMVVT